MPKSASPSFVGNGTSVGGTTHLLVTPTSVPRDRAKASVWKGLGLSRLGRAIVVANNPSFRGAIKELIGRYVDVRSLWLLTRTKHFVAAQVTPFDRSLTCEFFRSRSLWLCVCEGVFGVVDVNQAGAYEATLRELESEIRRLRSVPIDSLTSIQFRLLANRRIARRFPHTLAERRKRRLIAPPPVAWHAGRIAWTNGIARFSSPAVGELVLGNEWTKSLPGTDQDWCYAKVRASDNYVLELDVSGADRPSNPE